MKHIPQLTRHLSENDLVFVVSMMNCLIRCEQEKDFHALLLDFAKYLAFDFVLYAYMKSTYNRIETPTIVNLSNPATWHEEYTNEGYLEIDPVRVELEVRLASKQVDEFIVWDAYDRTLSLGEQKVIERRKAFGLTHGFSIFNNSGSKDSVFLLSFAAADTTVDTRCESFCRLLVSHFNVCRKRLNLLSVVNMLSKRERAIAELMAQGKTNWEIAQILGISERTVKFHIANVYRKFGVSNRQCALSVLLAAQFLS